jgi:hypothetical protein
VSVGSVDEEFIVEEGDSLGVNVAVARRVGVFVMVGSGVKVEVEVGVAVLVSVGVGVGVCNSRRTRPGKLQLNSKKNTKM